MNVVENSASIQTNPWKNHNYREECLQFTEIKWVPVLFFEERRGEEFEPVRLSIRLKLVHACLQVQAPNPL